MSFLPTDEREPVKNNYMKFADGNNTFRVLGSAVTGWEYWIDSGEKNEKGEVKGKSVRVKEEDSIPKNKVLTDNYGKLN